MGATDGFFVDPEALSAAGAGIGRLLGELAEVRFEEFSCDVFSHDELAGATRDFQERWQNGVGELAGDTSVIHRRIVDSVEEYRRADAEIAEVFRQAGA